MDRNTAQTLLDLLNPLHRTLDDQTSDDVVREELELPRDYEHNVGITPQMAGDLTKAVLILEKAIDATASPAVERAKDFFWQKADQYDREKLQATYNDLLALQDQTDQIPLATALDAVGAALAALSRT
jgi:hypothetical protein